MTESSLSTGWTGRGSGASSGEPGAQEVALEMKNAFFENLFSMVFEIAQMYPWSFNTRGCKGFSRSGGVCRPNDARSHMWLV